MDWIMRDVVCSAAVVEPSLDDDLEDEGMGLDNVTSNALRPLTSHLNTPRIDSYRFSMANLEDSQDVDLDAILGELCALETRCKNDVENATCNLRSSSDIKRTSIQGSTGTESGQGQTMHQHRRTHSRSSSDGNRLRLDGETDKNEGVARTDSPDNDSAFSDNVSMLSSESSASSGGSGGRTDHSKAGLALDPCPGQMDQASRIKAEKIRIALEKMKEASVKKLFIKAFSADGSTKSLLVDEKMTCAYVTRLLADKNHVQMDPKWAVVEHLPDLYMERVYEDHEQLVENLMMWTRDSKNKLLFLERSDKIQLFITPESFLLSHTDKGTDFDDHARSILLEEFFSSTGVGVPDVEGPLYLKADSKKGWKKHHFVLRASGLYYWPKEKVKSSRDLVCLATFDVNQVYYGVGWKKKYKAPTDFCFAIKHPRLQQPKSTKFIKFLCAEDESTLERWVMGIRIAKYGRQLMDNYRSLVDDLAQDDLDMLAHARSCSVSSISGSQPNTPCSEESSTNVTPTYTHQFPPDGLPGPTSRLRRQDSSRSRASSSSSSGCLSDGAPSSCEVGFECDFPSGTIKRKPSMNPKLPLTSITRQLKEVGETVLDGENTDRCNSPGSGSSGGGTLTRNGVVRQSRRRSCAVSSGGSEDGSSSGTLKRHHSHHRGSLDSTVCSKSLSGSSSNASTPIRERAAELSLPSPTKIQTNKTDSPNEMNHLASLPAQNVMSDSSISLPPLSEPVYQPDDDIICDVENLPPPPPEMFQSTLSLDSLPPPPPPSELPVYTDHGGSSLSLVSLPPPPSPCIDNGTIRRHAQKLPTPQSSASSTPTNVLSPSTTPTRQRPPCFSPPPSPRTSTSPRVPPKPLAPGSRQGSLSRQLSDVSSAGSTGSSHYAVPPYLAELKAGSPMLARKASPSGDINAGSSPKSPVSPATPSPPPSAVTPKSPILLTKQRTRTVTKKISFVTPDEVVCSSPPPSSPTYTNRTLSMNKKPLPPKRSESTRLSTSGTSPKKLSDADSTLTPPPKEFLKDLQRVMKKKWQVAQKCKLDSSTTPHEVLGFRDPPPPIADYRETNVSNWVQEHYGNRDNLYENVYLVGGNNAVPEVTYMSSPVTKNQINPVGGHMSLPSNVRHSGDNVDYYNMTGNRQSSTVAMAIAAKKRPPPPPPKRSETTQLSTTRLH
ncbi:ras-associated and pleckstrin homology domains-containing protein 1 isoform X2 [Anabrus simplex]|uniref:ras-associated and pleckstrin homology domains-containing protein 1 isoform X2 n=1 Tax=Anabrus simplex TaxID=316456 RepID=UPI0035A352C2